MKKDHSIEASFSLVDHINPSIGYQVNIRNALTGAQILATSVNPYTGEDLLTAQDCLMVISKHI